MTQIIIRHSLKSHFFLVNKMNIFICGLLEYIYINSAYRSNFTILKMDANSLNEIYKLEFSLELFDIF